MLRPVLPLFYGHLHHHLPRSSIRHSSTFSIVEHVIRCSHSRGRPAGVELNQEHRLRLHIKQYTPKSKPSPRPEDVTIIGASGNGFPKELYEPMWEDLDHVLQQHGRRIRSIWIADMAAQGTSGLLNADILGPDPCWYDHSHDLLNMINHFQDDVTHPMIGIGHSMGAAQLVHLSLLHPTLLDALVLIDPVIQPGNPSKSFAPAGTYRRDEWPSRADAAKRFAASPFYQKWDPRVLHRWIKHGLRDRSTTPSRATSTDLETPVTLTTPREQEVYHYVRPKYHDPRLLQSSSQNTMHHDFSQRDVDEHGERDWPFYRPEPLQIFRRLPQLRPHVLYLVGSQSPLASPQTRADRLRLTGTDAVGSGGVEAAAVQEAVLDCGHLVPMEKPRDSAQAISSFVDAQLQRWDKTQADYKSRREQLTRQQRIEINSLWKQMMGPPPSRKKR